MFIGMNIMDVEVSYIFFFIENGDFLFVGVLVNDRVVVVSSLKGIVEFVFENVVWSFFGYII